MRKMCEKQSCKYQGERRRRERGCFRHQSRDFSAPPREDHDEADILTGEGTSLRQMYMPWRKMQQVERPLWKQENSMRRKAQKRGAVMD